jgi:TetR/AcrR family transcriptional regulator, ethionamide resistance regulator
MASVTRANQRSRSERRAEWDGRFLAGTEKLLNEGNAFTDLSVDRLAAAAGTTRATFYVYYEDKGHLLRQLSRHVMVELQQAAQTWWQSATLRDPRDLQAAMKAIISSYRRHQALLSAVVETAGYDAAVAADFQRLMADYEAATREVIEQGRSAGTVRDLPVTEVACALVWMVERTCYQAVRGSTPDNDEQVATALAEIIWRTLYLEPLNPA